MHGGLVEESFLLHQKNSIYIENFFYKMRSI